MADLIGRRLGQYEITDRIGEGGRATVYQARHIADSRTLAVRVIQSRLARDPEFVRNFRREAEAIATLSHPHILRLLDFGQQKDLLFLVMDLVPGGSLAQLIQERPLPGPRVARYLDQIASALDYAHGESIIHRDLKPQNVLLDKQGNAILTDFGIARLMAADAKGPAANGLLMGTPAYMAPEQWHSRDIDGRADLYALGVMAYEMLAGQTPFTGKTPSELMHAHIYEPPPPIRTVRPDLTESVETVFEKALAKGREARFQSGNAFAEAFRAALTGRVPAWLEQGVPPEPETAIDAAGFYRRRASRRSPTKKPSNEGGRKPVGRRFGLLTVGLVVIIGVVALAILLVSRNRDGRGVTPTATSRLGAGPSATSVALVIPYAETAATITHAPSSTPSLTPSATPTETPDIPATVAVIVGLTDTAVALFSPTPTSTSTATPSLTPSATLTETPDIPATVAVIVGLTDTAVALFSPTPTSTSTATPSLTPSATPTWTLTPTSSLTATFMPSVTPTPLPTSTLTQTLTATPSFTSTPTSTATPSFTPSATPTETPDILGTVAHIVDLTNTAVALASATPTATPTFTSSATPTQTPTETTTPNSQALAITNAVSANLRAGPGVRFVRLGIAARDDAFPVIGRTLDGNWYQITLPDGREAWVSSGLVLISPPDAPIPFVTNLPTTRTTTPTTTPGTGR